MNTSIKGKNVLYLALGIALGYYAYKMYKSSKVTSQNTQPVDDCESQWIEHSKTMKMSEGALQNAKNKFIRDCKNVWANAHPPKGMIS